MVPAGAARRGATHSSSPAARGAAAARAPWRGPGRGDPGPGVGGGSSAAPSRALGAGSAAAAAGGAGQAGGRWRWRWRGRRAAGTTGGSGGPGRGWRAGSSCDLNTRSPPGCGRRRGRGGAGPLKRPLRRCRGKGTHRPEGRTLGSLHQGVKVEEMCDLKDRPRQESENQFIYCTCCGKCVVLGRQLGDDQCRST